jgi:transposase
MDKRIKYSSKQKTAAARSILSGRSSIREEAGELGCRKSAVERWVKQYKQHGVKGFVFRNNSYEGKFKLLVVRQHLKNGLSLAQTAVDFKIPNESVVIQWLRRYEQQGAAGLLREARGRKKTGMVKRTKKQTAVKTGMPEEKLAALQKEVEYLRAENAFLKKLDALIQQEQADKEQSKRQKPSRN